MPIWEYNDAMPRAATTTDAFNAIAEPNRRAIIGLLVGGPGVEHNERGGYEEHSVGSLVVALRMAQPAVSKHMGVLRKVGIVSVRKHGRQRLYRLNAERLKPVHDWVRTFERFWDHQLLRIKEHAEFNAATEARSAPRLSTTKRRRQP